MTAHPRMLSIGLLTTWLSVSVHAAGQDSDKLQFFEKKVRPILVEHCHECHGAEKQESDLRLDTAEGILAGGASGPAVVPGEVDQSLLLVALSYREDDLQMPPDGKLPDRVIADITRWVEEGAVLPDVAPSSAPRREPIDLDEARRFWAFQPPRQAPLPQVRNRDWPRSPIDFFVLAELEANKLHPVPQADRRTLIRRVTFDLLGIPPTPAEVQTFLDDVSPDAFDRVVDRLLSSPRYGERWGRHWLDVARYADSNGLDENVAHGNAWRYRDYVISAMNSDKPFDQFAIEQIAGDLLVVEDEAQSHEHLIGTGFLTLGPKVLAEGDEQKMEMDIIDEQIDTLGRAFLGLTLGCARCHDHKFDPISTRDYYALAGIFKSTRTMESFKRIARWNETSVATTAQTRAKAEHDERIAKQQAAIEQLVKQETKSLKARQAGNASPPQDLESCFPSDVQSQLKQLREGLASLQASVPKLPSAMSVAEGDPRNTRVHLRGSHLSLGAEVDRGVPEVLAYDGQPSIGKDHSGRIELAHWLVRPENPLTSRVIVNRVWRWHFGRGLVASTDNFGRLGERPVNQTLLDWLACHFVDGGWSLKELHRAIVLSSTYRMSSAVGSAAAAADPENRLHARADVRRLQAEAIRDSLLYVSGRLDLSMGGSMLHVGNREFLFDHTSKDETKYDSTRRAIYLPVIRNHLADVFSLFDYSDASVPNGDRATSTIAPQALYMMNSELLSDSAKSLAERLFSEVPSDDALRVSRLFAVTLSREANEEEIARGLAFVNEVGQTLLAEGAPPEQAASRSWEGLCHVLLASSEFLHVR